MYYALYRKYRPKNFDEVVGQNNVVQTLKNSIKNNCFTHAYMFFGPRGIGKTTISKIFARAINCTNSIDGSACGECDMCKKSIEKACVDIIEIDAASNNGVDEIRELKNKISLVPNELKFKVYIIDEVHMLSIGAFNALLKTLEEPPAHSIFILATTDSHKVPETVVSRCQCFSFKKIPEQIIVDRLKTVCNLENIEIEEKVLESISKSVDGGMRDALGVLDKLRSYNKNKITYDNFVDLVGVVLEEKLAEFCECFFTGNVEKVLKIVNNLNNEGKNLIQIFNQLVYYLRDLLVNFYVSNQKLKYNIKLVQDFLNYLNEKMFDIKKSDNVLVYIEITLLKFINDEIVISSLKQDEKSNNDIESSNNLQVIEQNFVNNEKEIEKEVPKEEKKDSNTIIESKIVQNEEKINFHEVELEKNDIIIADNPTLILNIEDIINTRINNVFCKANKEMLNLVNSKLKFLDDYVFDNEIGFLVTSILDSNFRVASDEIILISYEYDSVVENNIDYINELALIFNKYTELNIKFAIISDERWELEKSKYISNLKSGYKYIYMEEPKEELENNKKDDIINNEAIDLFGDIVEIN